MNAHSAPPVVTHAQLEESVARVGPFADEVELDLKGARTSTIAEQVDPGSTVACPYIRA